MSLKATIVLTGDAELNRQLRALTSKQAKEAIRNAARPALKPTLAAARSFAPKRTGRLASSIKIRAISRSRSRIGMRVTTSARDNQYSGKTFYAAFQEWGWKSGSRRGSRRSTSRRKVAAKEYLRRAARTTRSQVMSSYISSIREYIRRKK